MKRVQNLSLHEARSLLWAHCQLMEPRCLPNTPHLHGTVILVGLGMVAKGSCSFVCRAEVLQGQLWLVGSL